MKEHNKVVLITGANSGIGLELTKNLLLRGWEVAALIRSDFPNEQPIIIDALKKNHLRVYKADLADFLSLRNALDQIKKARLKLICFSTMLESLLLNTNIPSRGVNSISRLIH